jgi:hypothetical protein
MRYESQAAASAAMVKEVGETGESVGRSRRESRCRAKFVSRGMRVLKPCEARRDEMEIRWSSRDMRRRKRGEQNDEATGGRRASR